MTSIDSTRELHSVPREDRFDASVRQLHAQSLQAVSPRVAAQLQQRRRAALAGTAAGPSPPRRFGWAIGATVTASFAALLAVAIGLQPASTGQPTPGAPTIAATTGSSASSAAATGVVDSDGDGIADGGMLDENPDFYAWLASSDATVLAME